MSRKTGPLKRTLGRLFKERQIYHRSDGVVHFISMSSKTQIALAVMASLALMWVAYATVNVVFKEQIIIANEQESRLMSSNYRRNMQNQKRAYDEVNVQNAVLQQNYKDALDELAGRHQMLQTAVSRKADVNNDLIALSEKLSQAGSPEGKKTPNSNRVMIDVTPGEPTPRQSRRTRLRSTANREAFNNKVDILKNKTNAKNVDSLETAATELYTQQLLLLAQLEETALRESQELKLVLSSTGIDAKRFLTSPKIVNNTFAQGGPFIDIANLDKASPVFIKRVNRAMNVLNELERLRNIVERIPLSSPSISSRQMTSPFGIRRDPFNGRPTAHNGLDFRAPYSSPITATARGVIRFAGTRQGYGRVVEIDHGNGFVTRYAHMRRISVKKGQKVKLHDKVGELGSSGRSTGPHIHYEIRYNGKPQDPKRFIEAGRYVFES